MRCGSKLKASKLIGLDCWWLKETLDLLLFAKIEFKNSEMGFCLECQKKIKSMTSIETRCWDMPAMRMNAARRLGRKLPNTQWADSTDQSLWHMRFPWDIAPPMHMINVSHDTCLIKRCKTSSNTKHINSRQENGETRWFCRCSRMAISSFCNYPRLHNSPSLPLLWRWTGKDHPKSASSETSANGFRHRPRHNTFHHPPNRSRCWLGLWQVSEKISVQSGQLKIFLPETLFIHFHSIFKYLNLYWKENTYTTTQNLSL